MVCLFRDHCPTRQGERYWPNGSRPGTEWLVGRMVVVKVEVNSRGMKGVGRCRGGGGGGGAG